MKKTIIISIACLTTFFSNAQARVDNLTNKITNYHERLTFNCIGYNDYDLGTSSYLQFSQSIIKIDVNESSNGSLMTYILGEKKAYLINQCVLDRKTGSYLFELFDNDDIDGSHQTIISIEADLIVSQNTIQAFKIFRKGKNKATILVNR